LIVGSGARASGEGGAVQGDSGVEFSIRSGMSAAPSNPLERQMEIRKLLLIGGSGFLGSHLANVLSGRGYRVTVPTRRRERAKHLLPLPTTDVVEADVHDPAALGKLVSGQDAVVNLVGILHSRSGRPYGRDFAQAHVELPRAIVAACLKAGVTRLLHVSALKADASAPSEYLRSKAAGEAAVQEAGKSIATTIFRPSVVFGPGDSFLNMFAQLSRRFPVLPLACPHARFQPVFVDDVAHAIADSLTRPDALDMTYELCGPKVYTLRQLVEYVGETIHCRRPIIGLSQGLSYLQAAVMEWMPGDLMSRDNVASMQVDNVCEGCALPFGLIPTPLEAVAPGWLGFHVPRARFAPLRQKAHR